jgi:hypothetical protein
MPDHGRDRSAVSAWSATSSAIVSRARTANRRKMTMDAKTESSSLLRHPFKQRYENFVGGKWLAPVAGKYFKNPSPITGDTLCEVPRSDAHVQR